MGCAMGAQWQGHWSWSLVIGEVSEACWGKGLFLFFLFSVGVQVGLVHLDPVFGAHFLHQLADQLVRYVIHLFETYAAFTHVELVFTVLRIFGLKPFQQFRIGIYTHVIKIDRSFLGRDACKGQRILRIAMIARRIHL